MTRLADSQSCGDFVGVWRQGTAGADMTKNEAVHSRRRLRLWLEPFPSPEVVPDRLTASGRFWR
jgi:hypothetical protein